MAVTSGMMIGRGNRYDQSAREGIVVGAKLWPIKKQSDVTTR